MDAFAADHTGMRETGSMWVQNEMPNDGLQLPEKRTSVHSSVYL